MNTVLVIHVQPDTNSSEGKEINEDDEVVYFQPNSNQNNSLSHSPHTSSTLQSIWYWTLSKSITPSKCKKGAQTLNWRKSKTRNAIKLKKKSKAVKNIKCHLNLKNDISLWRRPLQIRMNVACVALSLFLHPNRQKGNQCTRSKLWAHEKCPDKKPYYIL